MVAYVCEYCDIQVANSKEGWDEHVRTCKWHKVDRGEMTNEEAIASEPELFTDLDLPQSINDLTVPVDVRIKDLRDWYAAMAMQSLIIVFGNLVFEGEAEHKEAVRIHDESLARSSYEIADAMLKQRGEDV